MRLWGLDIDYTDYLMLTGTGLPTDDQLAKGLRQSDWVGSGVSIALPHRRWSLTLGVGTPYLASTPAIVMLASSSDWSATYFEFRSGAPENGYRITFATINDVTVVSLLRLDNGAETLITSYSYNRTWASMEEHNIAMLIFGGGILIEIDGAAIIQSSDTTHRRTDWRFRLLSTSNATIYFREFSYLILHTTKIQYAICLLDKDVMTSTGYDSDGYITLQSGYDCIYRGVILPKSGVSIKCTFAGFTGDHYSRIGAVTPIKSHGIYVVWEQVGGTYYYRLKNAVGSTRAEYSSASRLKTSTVTMRLQSSQIQAVTSDATITSTTITDPVSRAVLHFRDDTMDKDIILNSIEVSPDDQIYGFENWTRESIIKKTLKIDRRNLL